MIKARSNGNLTSESEVMHSKSMRGLQSGRRRSESAGTNTMTPYSQDCCPLEHPEGQDQLSHIVPTDLPPESADITASDLNLTQVKDSMAQDLPSVVGGGQPDVNQHRTFNSSSRSVSPPSIRVPASYRLRAEIDEKDLFATINFMDDDTDIEDDDDDDDEHYFGAEDHSNSLDDTSSTTSGSGDSFGVESLKGNGSNVTEQNKNASDNKLANFLEGDKRVARRNLRGEEDDGRSMSIMSINSLPYATMEERSEDDDHFDDDGGTYVDRNTQRLLRSLASSAVMSTPAAYFALLDEHEKLLEQNEELQEIQARRKAEKNQLHKVLVSKEEEYVERRDRLEWLQSRLDFLEVELMRERASSNNSCSRAMNPLRSKQKAGWEALDSEVSTLDLLRLENKRLVDKLQEEPEVTHADVKMEMRLQRRRNRIMQLEVHEAKLKEDVEILRVVNNACKDYDGTV